MKKFLLLIAFIAIAISANAQFKLTIDGFVNAENKEEKYIVYDFKDMSQEELYKKALNFIHTSYKSPKDVINEIKPTSLTISGFQPECIGNGKALGAYVQVFDMQYNITLRFKDNKIRIDSPMFECKDNSGSKEIQLVLSGSNGGFGSKVIVGLFKKNGSPAREGAIKMLEDFFNNFCNKLKKSINDTTNDDW